MDESVLWATVFVALEAESVGVEVSNPDDVEEAVMVLVIDSMIRAGMSAEDVKAKVLAGLYGIHLEFRPESAMVQASLIWPDGTMSSVLADVSSLI